MEIYNHSIVHAISNFRRKFEVYDALDKINARLCELASLFRSEWK